MSFNMFELVWWVEITCVLYSSRVKYSVCLHIHQSEAGCVGSGQRSSGVVLATTGVGGCEGVYWLPENTGNVLLVYWTPPVGQTTTIVCIQNQQNWNKTSSHTEPSSTVFEVREKSVHHSLLKIGKRSELRILNLLLQTNKYIFIQ